MGCSNILISVAHVVHLICYISKNEEFVYFDEKFHFKLAKP